MRAAQLAVPSASPKCPSRCLHAYHSRLHRSPDAPNHQVGRGGAPGFSAAGAALQGGLCRPCNRLTMSCLGVGAACMRPRKPGDGGKTLHMQRATPPAPATMPCAPVSSMPSLWPASQPKRSGPALGCCPGRRAAAPRKGGLTHPHLVLTSRLTPPPLTCLTNPGRSLTPRRTCRAR